MFVLTRRQWYHFWDVNVSREKALLTMHVMTEITCMVKNIMHGQVKMYVMRFLLDNIFI